jgi:hypothetical protein
VAFILCVLPGLRAVPDQVCATLEVVDADADVILAKRYVQSSELIAQPCSFELDFTVFTPCSLEYRVHATGVFQIAIDIAPAVTFISDAPPVQHLARLGIGAEDLSGLHEAVRSVMRRLRPMRVFDHAKTRIGRLGDGGYVQIDDFSGLDTAFSLGISDEVSWDEDVADRGVAIYQFDHTVDAPHPNDPRMIFAKEMIADTPGPGRQTLAALVERHDARRSKPNIILKMDIECAEWSALDAMDASLLGRFSQIVCELHAFQNLWDAGWRSGVERVLRKLEEHYAVVHVHANVCGGVSCVAGVIVPNVLEVTFANRSLYAFEPSNEIFPGPLDTSCSPDEADLFLGQFRF